jgi:hypothetical protein
MPSFQEIASSNSGNSFNDIQHLEEDVDSIDHQGTLMTINDEHSYPSRNFLVSGYVPLQFMQLDDAESPYN